MNMKNNQLNYTDDVLIHTNQFTGGCQKMENYLMKQYKYFKNHRWKWLLLLLHERDRKTP